MKRYFLFMLSCSALFLAVVSGCKKDIAQIFLQGGNAPSLTASVADSIPLSYANQDNAALTLSWTNPDYQFTTGVSSQDVNYLIEIDTTGANFTNPARETLSIGKDLSLTISQSQFNDYLLNQLVLLPAVSHNVEIRLKSGIGTNSAAPLYSNVLKFAVTPYAIPPKVPLPSTGTLFITGDATPGNWQCGCGESELTSQKFNQISETLYELPSIYLIGGKSYTFVPVYGSWSVKYSIKIKNDPNEVNGGDFQVGGEDILAPATSGNYKIDVDFKRGKFTVTKL